MRKEFLVFMLFFLNAACFSQQFGGNPPSIKWSQVNNKAARIIFPTGLDSIAKRVGSIVSQLEHTTQSSIGPKTQKINIVLQQETTVSNGYVGLGPFRSEFNLTPAQNSFSLGSLPFHEQLAIHEFRHVQQNNNFNVGLSKAFRIVFGQQGQALANALVVPDWFYEGDAVFNETNVSRQGRGRLPFFYNDYRALWEDGRHYSWMKLRNGSLRDFVPNHYPLGYLMVAYGRQKYGDGFWRNVTHDAAAYKSLFYPFQRAVKKYSGLNYRLFRNNALQFFRTQTDSAAVRNNRSTQVPEHFTGDEEFPAFINDTTLVFLKSTYQRIPAFVIRSGNSERRLRVSDVTIDNYFSYRNGRIVYASFRPDLRWGWKDYSELSVLDVHTGRQRNITTRTRYFSPDINEDGSRIIAVKVQPEGSSTLEVLDGGNGRLVLALPNPQHLFYTYPKFVDGESVVSPVRDTMGRMSMALINLAKHTTEFLTPFSFNVLGFPFVANDTIYFSASHEGVDRLFACTITNRSLYQLSSRTTEGLTGDYQPALSRTMIVWAHFTSSGYKLEQASKSDLQWTPVSNEAFSSSLINFGVTVLGNNPAGEFLYRDRFAVTKYPKSYRLLNFHSLQPLIDDPVYSFSLVGENVLNTLQSELFFSYNRNEQYKQAGFNATYGAWFPYVSAGVNYTIDRRGIYHNQRIYWNEWELRGGLSVPLNLSRGRHFTYFTPGADLVYNQPNFKGTFKDSVGNQSFGYVSTSLTFSNQVQRARQQIYPRLAQTLSLNYRKAFSNFNAHQFLANGYLYLPGLAINHSLVLNGAFQQKDTLNQRSFTNNFPFSRGYTSESFYRMSKGGINYHFPLAYPDAGFANIVYLLRIRANLFYDHTVVTDYRLKSANFRSAGTEIFFDTKWWNQLPLSMGIRYSHLLDRDLFGARGSSRFEFVLPVNLLQR